LRRAVRCPSYWSTNIKSNFCPTASCAANTRARIRVLRRCPRSRNRDCRAELILALGGGAHLETPCRKGVDQTENVVRRNHTQGRDRAVVRDIPLLDQPLIPVLLKLSV